MTSIKQNSNNSIQAVSALASPEQVLFSASNRIAGRLPDFRNLGICLRILIIVNLMALITAILQTANFVDAVKQLTQVSIFTQPILLSSILLLYAASPRLLKLPYLWGVTGVILMEIMLTSIAHLFGTYLFGAEVMLGLIRTWLLAILVSTIVLYYFYLRHRALTPAIAEARLQALQARIRPHFLFNCINAVISVVRSNPKLAQTALEDMADLFRVLMADNRDLVPLAKEIALSRQYLALEKLRLEERLNIIWEIDNMPPDALIPPLVLQPLLENAVYHGIEPMPEGGEITIKIFTGRREVHLVMSNPYIAQGGHHNGNKMALTNIRERLALHFDAEAALTSKINGNKYEVHIVIPYHPHTST
jgi:two-component system sensor histidine kinase AlgZ